MVNIFIAGNEKVVEGELVLGGERTRRLPPAGLAQRRFRQLPQHAGRTGLQRGTNRREPFPIVCAPADVSAERRVDPLQCGYSGGTGDKGAVRSGADV